MNKTLTSREAILGVGKEIVIQSGLQALNIRDIADKCGISVGSIYNYFPSKSDLVVATIESVWREIMYDAKGDLSQLGFVDSVQSLFERIQRGCQKYTKFFSVHSMSIANTDKDKGREVMGRYFEHLKNNLLKTLDRDLNVRKDAFSDNLTKSEFVDFTLSNIISLLMKRTVSCDFLVEIIKRAIY